MQIKYRCEVTGMTKEERDKIVNEMINEFDESIIQPDELMSVLEMKAYLKGFEDAKKAFLDLLAVTVD